MADAYAQMLLFYPQTYYIAYGGFGTGVLVLLSSYIYLTLARPSTSSADEDVGQF